MGNTKQADGLPDPLRTALATLSPKERNAVKGVLEGKTKTQAMIDAGYSETTAVKRQQLVFGRERVQEAFIAAIESQGITPDRLAQVMKEGCGADASAGTGVPDRYSSLVLTNRRR